MTSMKDTSIKNGDQSQKHCLEEEKMGAQSDMVNIVESDSSDSSRSSGSDTDSDSSINEKSRI